ncbi:MAG: hypothetical protein J0H97_07500 [Alphaproteobacteria bacterium]|jgi:hypothetical protein|nr:hypothetical protein [Alphaproteobacteria bacterium]
MKILAALLVVLAAGAAGAQTPPPPPASTEGTAGVKQHLQSLHYGNIQNLRRGPDGQWTGKATQNGVQKNVTVSPNGTVRAR